MRNKRPYAQLSPDDVVTAAMAVADRGTPLTMSAVADYLGVATMTLYHYVKSKKDLQAMMNDQIMAEFLVDGSLPAAWPDALRAVARQTRAVLNRHPWAVTGMTSDGLSVHAIRRLEQSLAATATLPLPAPRRLAVIATMTDFVSGFVLKTDLEPGPPARPPEEATRFVATQLATGDYPNLTTLADDLPGLLAVLADVPPADVRFEQALTHLITGIAAELP